MNRSYEHLLKSCLTVFKLNQKKAETNFRFCELVPRDLKID